MKHPLLILLVALTVVALAQAAYQLFQLPALVAAHFDAAGQVNGWMSRVYYFRHQLFVVLAVAAVFGVLAAVAALLPDRLINLPHRDYWLAPARREETRRRLAGMVLASGCGAMAFFIFLHQRILQANHAPDRQLTPSFGVILAVALVLIVGPALGPLRSFWRRPPPAG